MQAKLKIFLFSLYLLIIASLSSCDPLFIYPANSDPVGLAIHGYIEKGADPKHCSKLQATISVLSDHNIIQSPILDAGNSFYKAFDKTYDQVRVKIEAHCYEANGISGKIIVEGKTYQRAKPGSNGRWFSISRYNLKNFVENCVSLNPLESDKNRDFQVIEFSEPVPCISISYFSP